MINEFVKRSKLNQTPEKDKSRMELVKYIVKYFEVHECKRVRFLTLSSAWWKFEKIMRKKCIWNKGMRIRPTFLSCERNWDLFCMASIRIPKRNQSVKQKLNEELNCQIVTSKESAVINCDVFDLMEMGNKEFNCIWLDTQSPVSYLLDKLPFIANVIGDGPSIVILTVLKGREHIKLQSDRQTTIEQIITNAIPTMRLAFKQEYFDTSPMLQMTFVN